MIIIIIVVTITTIIIILISVATYIQGTQILICEA